MAKFQKTGPTPANAVLVDRPSSGGKSANKAAAANGKGDHNDDEYLVDKTPIVDEEAATEETDDFGGFDEDEDEKYIEKGKKNAMRRRGLDPRALNKASDKKAAPAAKSKSKKGSQ